MRRIIPLVVAPLLAAGLLGACGDDDDTSTTRAGEMPADDHMTDDSDGRMGGPMADDMSDDGAHGHGGGDRNSPTVEGAREIAVTAEDFAFDPDEITVEAGEDVTIALTSVDVFHDFVVDELDGHVGADPDETASGGFRADEPGEYVFYCNVAGHREAGMEGTLTVEA